MSTRADAVEKAYGSVCKSTRRREPAHTMPEKRSAAHRRLWMSQFVANKQSAWKRGRWSEKVKG